MDYSYPQVSGGYRWNMLQRCLNEVGIEPSGSADIGENTVLRFERELTADEKTSLDALMADNPTLPPATKGSVFVIRDVWNQKDAIAAEMGYTYNVFYTESVPGSGNVDQIEIHFDQELTGDEATKVLSTYATLITPTDVQTIQAVETVQQLTVAA